MGAVIGCGQWVRAPPLHSLVVGRCLPVVARSARTPLVRPQTVRAPPLVLACPAAALTPACLHNPALTTVPVSPDCAGRPQQRSWRRRRRQQPQRQARWRRRWRWKRLGCQCVARGRHEQVNCRSIGLDDGTRAAWTAWPGCWGYEEEQVSSNGAWRSLA